MQTMIVDLGALLKGVVEGEGGGGPVQAGIPVWCEILS